jgi:hypothetical protein
LYYSGPGTNGWQPTSITQYDTAVVQVQNYSDGEIVHVRSQTAPPNWEYNGIMNSSYYALYSQGTGNGDTTPSFGVNSSYLVNSYTSNAGTPWATMIVPVGALLAAVVAAALMPPAWLAIPAAIAINVAASLLGSTTTSSGTRQYFTFLNAQWDAPNGYAWSAYVVTSNIKYDFTSNITADIPIMGIQIFANPPPPPPPPGGGGGGCVLYGTGIVLANGQNIQVQNLVPGDEVLSYN